MAALPGRGHMRRHTHQCCRREGGATYCLGTGVPVLALHALLSTVLTRLRLVALCLQRAATIARLRFGGERGKMAFLASSEEKGGGGQERAGQGGGNGTWEARWAFRLPAVE